MSADQPTPQLATGLAKLGLALRHETWKRGAARGLSPTQAQLLVALERAPGRRLGELAAELGLGEATVSEACSVLVEKELATKERSDDDGRALALFPTAAGRREARRARHWPDDFLSALSGLEPEEEGVLLRALTKILRGLQEEGRIPVTRMCATCRYFRPHAHADAARPHHCAFVDAAFGERELRLECADHEAASAAENDSVWQRFVAGGSPRR
jgi:DNA-binding MarR family transcriptional regulator